MNKTRYSDFHTYTEAKSVFMLSEERKDSKMNKISETKKSKENSSGAAKAVNNTNKWSRQNKKDQQSNTNSSVNKNSSIKCTYCGQDDHFAIKCFKNPQGGGLQR